MLVVHQHGVETAFGVVVEPVVVEASVGLVEASDLKVKCLDVGGGRGDDVA